MRQPVAAGSTLALSLLFTGCAAIVTGTEQTISVETPGCPGASCKLANDKGVWYVPLTPGSVTVHRAYSALTVTCTKEGISFDSVDSAASKTKGMAFGNILFGGIIGAGVDVGTGAAYDYPDVISIPFDCDQPADTDTTTAGPAAQSPPEEQADSDDCKALMERIRAAGNDIFAREVLENNYRNKCGDPATGLPEKME